jgi:hypothetical protein
MKAIYSALVKAQKGFGPALKSSTNPHFRSKYADLAACIEAVIDSLNENGVMLMQVTHEAENGVMIETLFLHESGEQMSAGKLFMPATKFDAQGFGSALSYARRYSLLAACGIAPEDDDANQAVKSTQAPQVKATPRPAQPPQATAKVDGGTQENIQAPTAPPVQTQPVHNAVDKNTPPAPPKMAGKADQWQLKITVDPNSNIDDWIEIVRDSSVFMLDMAQTKNDTMNIFRTNANIYNQLKVSNEAAYDNLMAQFKSYKEKLND